MDVVGMCGGNYHIAKEFFQLGLDDEEIEQRLGSVRHLPQSFQEMELLGKAGTGSTKKEEVCSFSASAAKQSTDIKTSAPANKPVTPESKFEAEFNSSPKLQAEFGTDGLADYLAFRRAEEAGRARMFKGKSVTSATAEDAKAELQKEGEFSEKLARTRELEYQNEFLASPELQAEFGGMSGLKDYIAYRKAEGRGAVKLIGRA